MPLSAEEQQEQKANPEKELFRAPTFEDLKSKPDFLLKEEDGTITYRGKYTIGDGGKVARYDIYKESNDELVQSDIPIYDNTGELVMIKTYHGDGKLMMLCVALKDGFKVSLNPKGEVLSSTKEAFLADPRQRD